MSPSGSRFRDNMQSSLLISFVSAVEERSVQAEDQDHAVQSLGWEQTEQTR